MHHPGRAHPRSGHNSAANTWQPCRAHYQNTPAKPECFAFVPAYLSRATLISQNGIDNILVPDIHWLDVKARQGVPHIASSRWQLVQCV